MAQVILSKRVRFCASHRLHSEFLSEEENKKIYGKCNNKYGHGHNYECFVKISGEVDPKTGMVMNLSELQQIIDQNVTIKLDHKHLNFDVDFMKDVNPTAENVAMGIWNQLVDKIPQGLLNEIELKETENNRVVYRGE